MFKNLLNFWRGKDFLTVVLEEFDHMLQLSEEMYGAITPIIIKGIDPPAKLKEETYSQDREINRIERDIRKKIVEHLALQPSVDIPVSLILMSVVKDAERIGDYCKNLYEIIELHHGSFDTKQYNQYLDSIDEKILILFSETRKAFLESDDNLAKKIITTNKEILEILTDALNKIANSSLTARDAVSLAATTRYFRRIAAHLGNIASSVIMPVSDLDYFDEEKIVEE